MQSAFVESLSRLGPVAAVALLVACVRPPLAGVCPEVQAGDLVLTEVRGPQTGDNSYRQWLELYNASDEPLALGGLGVAFTDLDGTPGGGFFVRDEGLVVDPGAYVVLGGGDPSRFPEIDYDYTNDWSSTRTDEDGALVDADRDGEPDHFVSDLPGGGFVDIHSCGLRVDRVLLRGLPAVGTLFWPGEPDADANDDGATWCVDDFSVAPTGSGVRGTPGEANPACPCAEGTCP